MAKKRDPKSKPVGEPQRILMERLDEMGVDMKAASGWIGRNPAYMQQYIFRGSPQHLSEVARVVLSKHTGLPEDELDPRVRFWGEDRGPAKVSRSDGPKGERLEIIPYPEPDRKVPAIPIYAAAQGGKGHWLVERTNPIEYTAPPEELRLVRDAYGILIKGESMIPAFRPGDVAWVNPHKLPERDTDVVLYHVPPDGEAEAIIKTLVSFSPKEWRLRQYNPPLDFTESRADWTTCHRIVGKKHVR